MPAGDPKPARCRIRGDLWAAWCGALLVRTEVQAWNAARSAIARICFAVEKGPDLSVVDVTRLLQEALDEERASRPGVST